MQHAATEDARLRIAATVCHGFFMPCPGGQRFCIYHPAQGITPRGLVLYVHPFAEEMNKCRRMAALQSRALAAQGYSVLQVDLLGCGDSSGDFADARWDAWVNDVVRSARWLRLQSATAHWQPLWLWGVRAGCLLALQAAMQMAEHCHFLFWQPAYSGRMLLQQFLRLHLGAAMRSSAPSAGAGAKSVMQGLHLRLQQGQPVEVAGYTLGAHLADGLASALLTAPAPCARTVRVEWFEVSALPQPDLGTMPIELSEGWRQPGLQLVRHALSGPAFWQSTEMLEVPTLIAATTAALATQGA